MKWWLGWAVLFLWAALIGVYGLETVERWAQADRSAAWAAVNPEWPSDKATRAPVYRAYRVGTMALFVGAAWCGLLAFTPCQKICCGVEPRR